jgi:hypothetical protein
MNHQDLSEIRRIRALNLTWPLQTMNRLRVAILTILRSIVFHALTILKSHNPQIRYPMHSQSAILTILRYCQISTQVSTQFQPDALVCKANKEEIHSTLHYQELVIQTDDSL